MRYLISVQTGQDRIENFTIDAQNFQEAWNKGIRVSKCPVIIDVKEVI